MTKEQAPLVVILVEGGIVQSVVATQPGAFYRIIDLDQDSLDPAITYDTEAEIIPDLDTYTQEQLPGECEWNKDDTEKGVTL